MLPLALLSKINHKCGPFLDISEGGIGGSSGCDNNIIARILERRLKMECQTEESENDEEDDDRISDCTSVQVRLITKTNIENTTEDGPTGCGTRNTIIFCLV